MEGSRNSQIVINHPLYLQPSEGPVMPLISFQLVGTENYALWSRAMKILLLVKNKIGFVDETYNRESIEESLRPIWDRMHAIILS